MPGSNQLRPHELLDRSHAFRKASLLSEEGRAYAVIGVTLILLVPITFISAAQAVHANLKVVGAFAAIVLLAIQVGTIAMCRRARRHDQPLPNWLGAVSVAIECSIPTAAIFTHIRIGTLEPYTALTAPPILAYALLVGLSTLRLRPGLCMLGGSISALGYAGMLGYVALVLKLSPPPSGWPRPGYLMAILLIFSGGVAAAWVAREIRRHVEAALGEAETRRQVERLEQDLAVARTIQQALLPRSAPSIPGYDIAAWSRPADQTGGDYYDWQMLPDGNWIVTLADVCGHGIGPALVTAACRAYVRASSDHHTNLAALATRINRLLADDLPEGRFVTMANVLINPRGGPLALLSAGHGPIVFFVGATRQVKDILPHDLPLAVAPEVTFGPAQPLELAPGDVLALITDGCVEWSCPGHDGQREQYGMTRLREALARHAGSSASTIAEALAREVASFARGEPQQDDLTMVIIRRTS